MKLNRIILPVVAATMLLTGCDDMKMEWGTPEGHSSVTAEDIPLAVKEVLANYGTLKEYSAQYMPNSILGLGFGVDKYITVDETDPYRTLPNENYQMFTPGNAMKMGVMVSNSGAINFETVDKMLETMPSGMKLYGHNFIWHTQQQQTYLKSLIDAEQVIETSGDIASVLKNGSFEDGMSGWGYSSWNGGQSAEVKDDEGPDGSKCAVITKDKDGEYYNGQFYQDLSKALVVGTTYKYRFKAKCSIPSGTLQVFAQQPSGSYPSEPGNAKFNVGTSWTTIEGEFTVQNNDQLTRFIINYGKVAGTYYIDDVEFGEPAETSINYVNHGTFEDETIENLSNFNSKNAFSIVEMANAPEGSHVMKVAVGDKKDDWDYQYKGVAIPVPTNGKKLKMSFYIKSETAGQARVSFTGMNNNYPWIRWTGSEASSSGWFDTDTNWKLINFVIDDYNQGYKEGETSWTFNMDMSHVADVTYYIDDIKVEEYEEEAAAASARTTSRAASRATSISYKLKSADEKREALLGAMDSWIKGVADHLKEKDVTPYGYDVINEPIEDKTGKPRGVKQDDGSLVFNGTDTEPVETTEEGLTLNWASDTGNKHFYWGYYVPDYAVQAFSKARQYLPDTKLFVNDYGLESSTTKLQGFIDFVTKIDADYKALGHTDNVVDGVGTQMHLNINVTDDTDHNAEVIAEWKTKIDNMFQKLAATGKLVRVTEFDIAINAKSPSAAQYKAQADAYKMVFESYKANVPADQQSGITIWSLSDAEDEHEYWLNGDHPNLFDANYKRKWAYKGVCDGIAGEDLGLKYGGDDYKAYYEKSNVSETVK